MPHTSRSSGQSGFSLIELMVAMLVTLIVTGAVYGLMAGGNNAFRREPELTDRQQNARVAMEMIQKDIGNAGVNMGPFFQSFSRGLNGVGRITGPGGQVADHLEIFGNDGSCPDAPAMPAKPISNTGPTSGSNINVRGGVPDCYSEKSLVLVVYGNGLAKWGLAFNIHSKDSKDVNFPNGQNDPPSQINGPNELAQYSGTNNSAPVAMSPLQLIRYEIALDPSPDVSPSGVPSLYRSPTGGINLATGDYVPPTSVANIALGRWQVLARGVEDLQAQYRDGTGAWTDQPTLVSCPGNCATPPAPGSPNAAAYNTATREVRVTMTVRAEGNNLQGQTTGAVGGAGSRANAVRGNVTTVTSVKALQNYLAAIPPSASCPECPVWR